MGDLCLMENDDVCAAMGWYLKHSCVTKELDTEYIMEELVDILPDKGLAIQSLIEIGL